MSAKTATATATASKSVMTDKFKKELENFYEWAVMSSYIIKDINDEQHEWSMKLLNKFEEPGRNKLEAYIKALFAKYTITLNDADIEDAKLLAKEFKEKSKTTQKVTEEVEEKPKKKTTKKVTEEVEEKPKKSIKKDKTGIKLDMTLDTSETYNVDTLDFWTEELVSVFGKPKKTGSKEDEHTWEWKIEVNGDVYSIYDWNENKDSFEEATWYLGATSDNKKNVKALNDYIESFLVPEEAEIEEVAEIEEPEIDHKELFGDDDEEIELDLDDIEDDE